MIDQGKSREYRNVEDIITKFKKREIQKSDIAHSDGTKRQGLEISKAQFSNDPFMQTGIMGMGSSINEVNFNAQAY